AAYLTDKVIEHLEIELKRGEIPTVEQVQDFVEKVMIEEGHAKTFKSKVSKGLKKSDVPSQVTWGTPEQVFEWKQKEKGYIKFVDANGKNKWGTPKQVAEWKKEKNANK
ncbi:MAG: hypothetical protein P8X84_05885, partial [Candidatus Bathyarchaeota archaeon]